MNLFYQCIITLRGVSMSQVSMWKVPSKVHYWPIKSAASNTAFTQWLDQPFLKNDVPLDFGVDFFESSLESERERACSVFGSLLARFGVELVRSKSLKFGCGSLKGWLENGSHTQGLLHLYQISAMSLKMSKTKSIFSFQSDWRFFSRQTLC